MDDASLSLVAYYDPDYPSGWVHSPELIAGHMAQRHGFVVLDARRLGAWMRAVVAAGTAPTTVCVLTMGIAPDTIAERLWMSTTARRYLDAGGRLVWIGDVPFYYQGRRGGAKKEWGDAGQQKILGLSHIWAGEGPPAVTEAGRAWGLELPDAAERCAKASAVTALTQVGVRAASWHKVYNPKHPLQGFLRYRGGAFGCPHWNAKCNELYRFALRGFAEPFRAPRSWDDPSHDGTARAVFSDPRYPASWSPDAEASARRLAEAHGFKPLDADALAAWMRAKVARGAAGSVCAIVHGAAPDTVYDRTSPQCLARRYMDAGGRLVWAGDVPFLYRGRRDGGHDGNSDTGTHEAVLDIPVRWDWEVGAAPSLTEAGKAWGMRTPDEAARCVDASCVSVVLAGSGPYASSWLKTYDKGTPGSGFLRFRGGAFAGPSQADELAAVALQGLPPPAAGRGIALPEPEGKLAGSGAFVVDRARALEKIRRFMLPSAESFIFPLARAASAVGAELFRVEDAHDGRTVSFDGRGFPAELLADPFSPLVAGTPDAGARSLAVALLTVMRASPLEVQLIESQGGAVSGVRILPDLRLEPIPPAPGTAFGTTVRVIGSNLPGAAELMDMLRLRAPGFAALEPKSRGPADPLARRFTAGPVSGLLRVPGRPAVASQLDLCVHGVSAGPASLILPALQVEGWVNDDRLSLNASLSGVVRDEHWEDLAPALAAEAEQLALAAAAFLTESLPRRQEALAGFGGAALWRRALAPAALGAAGRALAAAVGAATDDAAEEDLEAQARAARWLREAAGRLLSDLDRDRPGALRQALWGAPLLTGVDGEAMSLQTLELRRRAEGVVRFSARYRPGARLSAPVVWAEDGAAAALLKKLFGDAVEDLGADLSSVTPSAAAGRAGALERAGAGAPLTRRLLEPEGEVGLRAGPAAGMRLFGLTGGRPGRFRSVASLLRIDAAREGAPDDAMLGEALARVDALYRGLCSDVACPVARGFLGTLFHGQRRAEAELREAAALEHLRDYLQWSLEPSRSAGREWVRAVPLFESSAGWLSFDAVADLRRRHGALVVVQAPSSQGFLPRLHGGEAALRRLRALFPGLAWAKAQRFGRTVLLKAPPLPRCGHQAPFGCLAEGELCGVRVHLAVNAAGDAVAYPLPAGEPAPLALEDAKDLAADAALAVLFRAPAAVQPGEHPWRKFLLRAVAAVLAPLPGPPERGALLELLSTADLFRSPWGPKSLLEFSWGGPSLYARPGQDAEGASSILDDADLALLRTLWPREAKLLLTADEH
ncbi:MAG: hypothetical protein HY928_08175, partial [Elusimicrobia bacterium]|nr:hypothetical protein [Elusimicrobiota bacterium]